MELPGDLTQRLFGAEGHRVVRVAARARAGTTKLDEEVVAAMGSLLDHAPAFDPN